VAAVTAKTVTHTLRALAQPSPWNQQVRREGFEPPTARSVAWCSASIWMAPDGSGLLTLEASSVQTDPVGSSRIIWMIKRIIKPAATCPPHPVAAGRMDDLGVAEAGGQPVKLGAQGDVKRRHPRSARRDRQIARRSGRLGAPRTGSRAGEAAAPHGRWSAPAVRCSTGQRAGRGGGRPPTRQPGRAGPGCCRGYGRRRGRTPNGCGHTG
jgi:hypothetical protein